MGSSSWRIPLLPCHLCRRRGWLTGIALALLALVLGGGWAGLRAREDRAVHDEFWRAGVPAAIAVHAGSATFKVATPGPSAEVLVVVSALTRARGPFPLELKVKPAAQGCAPDLAYDGPRFEATVARVASTEPANAAQRPPKNIPPQSREFHMLVRDGDVSSPSNYAGIHGVLRGLGRRVQVYVASEDLERVHRGLIEDIITTFDDRVYPLASTRFGTARDVDGDGRFTILLSSWLNHLGGGRFAVDGFVRVADLDTDVRSPFGNQSDMMYLSTELKAGPHLRTVLAHEYMHAVVFSQKALGRRPGAGTRIEEEGWLDEAIAHLFEDMNAFSTSNIDYRISAFLSAPERYQLVVDDYYAENLFRSHGNRGSTYLFLRWCADRYGPGLVSALIQSDLRGVANLESATGSTFAALYRRWSLALYRSGLNADTRPGSDDDGFDSVRMRSPQEEWELAGPRFHRVAPGSPVERWTALGTTSHFVIIDGFPRGAIQVEITGPPAALLQVTAVPLGADSAGLDLSVNTIHGKAGELRLRAAIRERHGAPARLGAVSWEPLVPGASAGGFRCGRLDTPGIVASFGTAALEAAGELRSQPIGLLGVTSHSGPLIVKVTGTDSKGRHLVAWADLNTERTAGEP